MLDPKQYLIQPRFKFNNSIVRHINPSIYYMQLLGYSRRKGHLYIKRL